MTCKYWAQISKLRTKEEDSLPAEDCWSQNDEANNNAWNFDYISLFICVQVFVHFGASWCVPSLAMNSFFEELALTYQDILFLVVDVDEVKVWFMTSVAMILRKIMWAVDGSTSGLPNLHLQFSCGLFLPSAAALLQNLVLLETDIYMLVMNIFVCATLI